jgi:hypothetical protein
MAMFPENTDDDVNTILSHLGVTPEDAQKGFVLEQTDPTQKTKHPFPTPCTVYEAV